MPDPSLFRQTGSLHIRERLVGRRGLQGQGLDLARNVAGRRPGGEPKCPPSLPPSTASVREPKCRLTQRNNNSMSSSCKIYGSKNEDINGAKHLFVVEIMKIGLVIGNGTPTTQLVSKPCKRGLSNILVHLFLQPRMLSFHLNGQGQLLR